MTENQFQKSEVVVSWLIASHIGGESLYRAIRSCLSQDQSPSFEVVLVLNGPNREGISSEVQKEFSGIDNLRVFCVELPFLNFSLNFGLNVARGRYIARLDSDDYSDSSRINLQLSAFSRDPELGVVGSFAEIENNYGQRLAQLLVPTSHGEIVRAMRTANPFIHPSVMYKREVVLAVGGYPGHRYAQDYELWLLLISSSRCRFENIPLPLVSYASAGVSGARGAALAYANVSGAQFRVFLLTGKASWLWAAVVSGIKCFARRYTRVQSST